MYKFSEDIRVRTCGELTFLVNISDNTIYMIKTDTLHFLKEKIDSGLNKNNIKQYGNEFVQFVISLMEICILEVDNNEN